MGSLIFPNFRKLFVLYVIFPISVAGSGLSWTGGVITVPESGKKAESDRTEKSSQDVIHVLLDPSKIYPGGYLFQVTIGVKFEGDNFQEFEGIEKRVARSTENLIKHQLSTFSPSLKKLLLHSIERINAPVLFLTYWLYFNPGGQDIYGPLEIQLNQLKAKHVANLRHGKATLFFKSIEDVNECSSGLSMCDPRADCFNAFGFYSCRCIEGFEDRSLNGSGIECIVKKSGGSMHSPRCFHVKYLDHNTPLELELLSPSFKRFQQMDVVHETPQRIHTKNLFQAEVMEHPLQLPGREWPATNSQLIPKLSASTSGLSIKHQAASFAGPQAHYTSYPQPLFTAVQFTTLSGQPRPSGNRPHLPSASPLKPTRSLQMGNVTSEWLKLQVKGNGDISQPSKIKRNPVNWKFDKFSSFTDAPCPWQISYSTSSGFWSSSIFHFLGEVNPTLHSFQSDALLKLQVDDYSRISVKLSSDFSLRNFISDSKHPAINPANIIHQTRCIETHQRKYWGSLTSDGLNRMMSLLNWLDPTEGEAEKQNNRVLSEVGVLSQTTICGIVRGLAHEGLEHLRTKLLKTSLSYGHVQREIQHHVPCDPKSTIEPGNDRMSKSVPIYSVWDEMLPLLLTPSLDNDLRMKSESWNLYSESFAQTIFHQTHTMELQLIIPTHADMSSVANSSVMTTGKGFLNYAVDWQMSSLWRTSPTLDAAQWAVDAATNPTDKTSLLDAIYPVEPSMSQNPTWTTLAPKLHDIGSLLAVSAGMELINVVYKNLQHLEKKVLQSVKALIMDSLASFSPPLKKILFQGVRRINSSGLAIDYQLYFGLNGENISHSLQIHLNKFLNKSMVNLRNGRIYLSWVLVGDVDECQSEIAACSKEAKCLNTVGSYFCQCEDGFEDRSMGHSHICIDPLELDPRFWLSFGLQEILIGSAICTFLLSAVILILCFVIYKRSQNKYFRACDINLGGVAARSPLSSAGELESEESLVIIPHRISSYVSFTKFQPILEEPNGQEIDSDSELSNPYEMKPQPTFRTFHL
ncbi:uncharacterized protein zgc:66455 isoform X1 [Chiloscyllium plagiosum]|uniref:uncharacterized protein zgc:66455 isoform X1 n=1 Tax=Chiloscyllium plagiosum TaxID=36176 RepID=UPI001CB84033|nr:uncharacterized protein zgc:66455 isoform X1 [Chiloscyllium plagiosum]